MGRIARRIDIYQNPLVPRGRQIADQGEQSCLGLSGTSLPGLQGPWWRCGGRLNLLAEIANDLIGAACRRATAASSKRRRSPAATGPEKAMLRRSANCERRLRCICEIEFTTRNAPFHRASCQACECNAIEIRPSAQQESGQDRSRERYGSVKAAWLFSTPVRQEPSHFHKRVAEMSLIWINGDKSRQYAISSASRTRCPARGARFIDPCARLTNLQLKEDIGIRAELRSQQPGRRRAVEPFPAGLFVWAGLAAVKRRDVAQAQVRNDAAARLDTEALHRSNHVIGIQLAVLSAPP